MHAVRSLDLSEIDVQLDVGRCVRSHGIAEDGIVTACALAKYTARIVVGHLDLWNIYHIGVARKRHRESEGRGVLRQGEIAIRIYFHKAAKGSFGIEQQCRREGMGDVLPCRPILTDLVDTSVGGESAQAIGALELRTGLPFKIAVQFGIVAEVVVHADTGLVIVSEERLRQKVVVALREVRGARYIRQGDILQNRQRGGVQLGCRNRVIRKLGLIKVVVVGAASR